MYSQITANKRKTIFLMMIFICVIIFLGGIFGYMYGDFYTGLFIATIFSLFMNLFGYYKGDSVALSMSGARQIQKNDNPYVFRMVENLSITSGLPMPKVYIIQDTAMNAFATGRDPQNASIALTQGIINKLENEELEGVIAHEMAHIKNYDIRIMTIVIVLIGIIILLSDLIIRIPLLGRGSRDNNKNPLFLIIGIVLAILSPIFGQLIQLAISRKREFLADATGALLTRYPEGLARALEKISTDGTPMKKTSQATAHLFISNPFGSKQKIVSKLFATHPPIEERISELRKMA